MRSRSGSYRASQNASEEGKCISYSLYIASLIAILRLVRYKFLVFREQGAGSREQGTKIITIDLRTLKFSESGVIAAQHSANGLTGYGDAIAQVTVH